MPNTLSEIPSPAVLIDLDALDKNLRTLQEKCDETHTELWPHIKTHKLVPILKRQLTLGAKGCTCAKIGEAEAMLPSGVQRIFIAHSIVDMAKAPRLKALKEKLEQLILAVTSEGHYAALDKVLKAAGIQVDILLAVDTGLGREGVRTPEAAAKVADLIRNNPHMHLIGLYSHEGHAYGSRSEDEARQAALDVNKKMRAYAAAVGGDLPLYPGCSVTAYYSAGLPGVTGVRPGAYVFGDMSLTTNTKILPFDRVALTVLATVVDKPEPGLALIDAGSKVFSGDKTKAGVSGLLQENPNIQVSRVNEEHGYLTGEGVDALEIGQRLRFQTSHVCPVLNLTDKVYVVRGNEVLEVWTVDGRGRSD